MSRHETLFWRRGHAWVLPLSLVAQLWAGCEAGPGIIEEERDISEVGDPEEDPRFEVSLAAFSTGTEVEVYRVRVGLNCRSGPGKQYMNVRMLGAGEKAKVLKRSSSGKWYQLDLGTVKCWSYGYYLRQAGSPGEAPPTDSSAALGRSVGSVWHTFYHLARQDQYPGADYKLYDNDCRAIVTSTYEFYASARMQGSAKLSDGRVINYAGVCTCAGAKRTCFRVLGAEHPWGLSASGRGVVPLRSIAVDPGTIPLGSLVYIKAWDGKVIPKVGQLGGFTHDGCFRADDTGDRITGAHYDFFAGSTEMWRELEKVAATGSYSGAYLDGKRCEHVRNLSPQDSTPPSATPSGPGLPGTAGGSCANRCGAVGSTTLCHCDILCSDKGDCCADYQSTCGPSTSSTPSTPPTSGSATHAGWSFVRDEYRLTRSGVINSAAAFVGFSYAWGGASLPNPWETAGANRGSCQSSGYAGHRGNYGADCSGLIGDVWQLPEHQSFESGAHPFSTYELFHQRDHWAPVERNQLRAGDILVLRTSRGGHALIFNGTDAWGKVWVYESRDCESGIAHSLRSVGSAYRGRRRNDILD